EGVEIGRLLGREESPVRLDAVLVVDVEQTPARTAEHHLVGTRTPERETRRLTQVGPALPAGVELFEFEPGRFQEVGEGGGLGAPHVPAQLLDLLAPPGRNGAADVREHDFARLGIQLHVATRREKWEALLDLGDDLPAAAPEERAETSVEAE